MSKPDRMGEKKYLNTDLRAEQKAKDGYVNPRKLNASEDDLKSVTVPGQSQTIKELMDRYEKGRPRPTEI